MVTNKRFSLYIAIFVMFFIGTGLFALVIINISTRNIIMSEIRHTKNALNQLTLYNPSCDEFLSMSTFFKDNNTLQAVCFSGKSIHSFPSSSQAADYKKLFLPLVHKLDATNSNGLISETRFKNKLIPVNARVVVVKRSEHKNKTTSFILEKQIKNAFLENTNYVIIALSFLAINSLVFTLLISYRLHVFILKPLENMTYTIKSNWKDLSEETLNLDNFNEFNQLWYYLKQMITRIRNDNSQLQVNVKELSQLNTELQQLQEDALRAEKLASIGRLSSGLAHEIGNPLTITRGYLEMITQQDTKLDKCRDFAQRAEKEVERIDKLIKQLLNCSHQINIKPSSINIAHITNEALKSLEFHRSMQKISIIKHFNDEDIFAIAEEEGLRQVLMNCFLNSIDAIEECKDLTKPKIEVHINDEITKSGAFVVIKIQDNGNSVTDEQINNVFDPFFTTKEPGKGVGLGLAISYTLIDQFGGKMSLQRRETQGSQMLITLSKNQK